MFRRCTGRDPDCESGIYLGECFLSSFTSLRRRGGLCERNKPINFEKTFTQKSGSGGNCSAFVFCAKLTLIYLTLSPLLSYTSSISNSLKWRERLLELTCSLSSKK